jgi:hypothetical protein
MAEFMPHNAPLVTLTFLCTGLALSVAGVLFVWMLGAGKRVLATKVLLAGALTAGGYAGLLLGFSLTSEEKTLAAGELKYFCEMDCHAAYAVTSVRTAKMLGAGAAQATAEGVFHVVTVRTWFDERTIASQRPKGLPLRLNPRVVRVLDQDGRSYRTSLAGQKAIGSSGVPLGHPLEPGESYETALVFDLPADARGPRLLLADWDPVTMLLIGHENSFLHKKVYFGMESSLSAAQP